MFPFPLASKSVYTINADSPSVNGTATMEGKNGLVKTMGGEEPKPEAGKFRTILPQILASTAKNFLLLDLGMAVALPTIVIPALRGLKNRAPDEFLHFTPVQASWFGKKWGSVAVGSDVTNNVLSLQEV